MPSSFSELEYASKKKQTQRDRVLAEIDTVTSWVELGRTVTAFYPSSGGRGRPPNGLARRLRMYVAQQCFGLSDEGVEDAIYDSQAIRRFVGIDLNRESAPNATTLLNFRHLLESHQLTESIFNTINGHLAEKGLLLGEGTIIDATPLGGLLERLEHTKASIRAKVEHPFHVVKNLLRHRKTRYKGLAKNTVQLFSLFGLANLFMARRWLLGEHTQGAS